MPVFSSRTIVPKGTRISRSSALGLVFALPCPRVPLSAIMWRLARTDAYPVFSSEISVLFRDWCELMRTKPCLPVSSLVHALGTYIHSCKSVPSYLHSWYIHLFICIHGTFISTYIRSFSYIHWALTFIHSGTFILYIGHFVAYQNRCQGIIALIGHQPKVLWVLWVLWVLSLPGYYRPHRPPTKHCPRRPRCHQRGHQVPRGPRDGTLPRHHLHRHLSRRRAPVPGFRV